MIEFKILFFTIFENWSYCVRYDDKDEKVYIFTNFQEDWAENILSLI